MLDRSPEDAGTLGLASDDSRWAAATNKWWITPRSSALVSAPLRPVPACVFQAIHENIYAQTNAAPAQRRRPDCQCPCGRFVPLPCGRCLHLPGLSAGSAVVDCCSGCVRQILTNSRFTSSADQGLLNILTEEQEVRTHDRSDSEDACSVQLAASGSASLAALRAQSHVAKWPVHAVHFGSCSCARPQAEGGDGRTIAL